VVSVLFKAEELCDQRKDLSGRVPVDRLLAAHASENVIKESIETPQDDGLQLSTVGNVPGRRAQHCSKGLARNSACTVDLLEHLAEQTAHDAHHTECMKGHPNMHHFQTYLRAEILRFAMCFRE
jgi:hypothetical protein